MFLGIPYYLELAPWGLIFSEGSGGGGLFEGGAYSRGALINLAAILSIFYDKMQ